MFNNILVPTDGSEGMARVIDQASGLAVAHDAVIHFLYVVHTTSFGNLPLESSWEGVGMTFRESGKAALSAAERRAAVDRVETTIADGIPSREIVAHADEIDCDLIVMGTHGRGSLNRLLFGSVSDRVVRSAEIPVMTIRVGNEKARLDPPEARKRSTPTESSSVEALE